MTAPVSCQNSLIYDAANSTFRVEAPCEEIPAVAQPVDQYVEMPAKPIFDKLKQFLPSFNLKWFAGTMLPGLMGSAGVEEEDIGQPVKSVTATDAAPVSISPVINGNFNGYGLSGNADTTLVAWSVLDGSKPEESGTFAYLRSAASSGSVKTVSKEVIPHLQTSSAVLNDSSSVVAYTKTVGEEKPSSIKAYLISASGTVSSQEIELAIGKEAKLVALSNGFVAVYRDPNGSLKAAEFDLAGKPRGVAQDLGGTSSSGNDPDSKPAPFALASGGGDRWALAEFAGNSVRIRSFNRLTPQQNQTINSDGIAASAQLAVAMQPDGRIMAAWNSVKKEANDLKAANDVEVADDVENGGIEGVIVGSGENKKPFPIRGSSLANAMALAADGNGNFILAWEEGSIEKGTIFFRTYESNGNYQHFEASTGGNNTKPQVYVSADKMATITWVQSRLEAGATIQTMMKRDYKLEY